MAAHRSTDAAPADDQAFSEAFDEDKSATPVDQRRPDRRKADADTAVSPLDHALDGSAGERFGETVLKDAAGDDAADGAPAAPNRPGVRAPDDPDEAGEDDGTLDPDEKVDEGVEESFPASDPPAIRPGEA